MRNFKIGLCIFLMIGSGKLQAQTAIKVTQGKNRIVQSADGEQTECLVVFGGISIQILSGIATDVGWAKQEATSLDGAVLGSDKAISLALTEPHWIYGAEGGSYFPASKNSRLVIEKNQANLRAISEVGELPENFIFLSIPQTSLSEMVSFGEKMLIPISAPVQVTQNDSSARIFYDKASKTTAYVVEKEDPRMDSMGYLNGCDQPCAILIQSGDKTLKINAGKKVKGVLSIKIFGDWKSTPEEAGVVAVKRQAGRTWIELTSGPDGSEEINLVALPPEGFLQRILERFLK